MFAQNTGDGTGGSTENKINRLKVVFRPKHIICFLFCFFLHFLKCPLGKDQLFCKSKGKMTFW